ncbi:hypothetical protein EYF80_026135 [Liparis tanakae]|uniref:Uncharacterized protein n=1 Tax=Liparis tanakae TaxID=230148 RepID=A0A4Z2HCP5_9TELE|nr:hypothetical protein EYF80_026135 [Liparis tanakae]
METAGVLAEADVIVGLASQRETSFWPESQEMRPAVYTCWHCCASFALNEERSVSVSTSPKNIFAAELRLSLDVISWQERKKINNSGPIAVWLCDVCDVCRVCRPVAPYERRARQPKRPDEKQEEAEERKEKRRRVTGEDITPPAWVTPRNSAFVSQELTDGLIHQAAEGRGLKRIVALHEGTLSLTEEMISATWFHTEVSQPLPPGSRFFLLVLRWSLGVAGERLTSVRTQPGPPVVSC